MNELDKTAPTPAECLEDAILPGGWKVLARAENAGRGNSSSVCWVVERDGERAFLKAIDLRRALRSDTERPMEAVSQRWIAATFPSFSLSENSVDCSSQYW